MDCDQTIFAKNNIFIIKYNTRICFEKNLKNNLISYRYFYYTLSNDCESYSKTRTLVPL